MPAPRSKRYDSEYASHYKSFDAKRPHTVKGEVTRSLNYDDVPPSIGSTPRAGVASSKSGIIHEPPLQRKKIVPYEKNHNLLTTATLKEVPDRKWLRDDDSTTRPTPARKPHKSSKGTNSGEKPRALDRGVTPILAAERRIFHSPPKSKGPTSYPYVSDRISRKSTYKKDYPDYTHYSRARESRSQHKRPPAQRSKSVGSKPATVSPDRLPPAGVRTETSLGDARLLQPSDNSNYMRSPEGHGPRNPSSPTRKVYDSEYRSHYRQPTKFKYVSGVWMEKPAAEVGHQQIRGKLEEEWFKQAVQRRNEAYGYSHRSRGTHFSRESLDEMNREQARRTDEDSPPSERPSRPSDEYASRSDKHKSPDKPPRRREAWTTPARPRSPTDSEVSRITQASEKTYSVDSDELFIERGRSPTPELRELGQSRRHHLDLTTNILNDRLKKSLSLSATKGDLSPRGARKLGFSPPSSVADRASDVGSYVPPGDDDGMSEGAMSSRASVASETLERAKKRREEFWGADGASR